MMTDGAKVGNFHCVGEVNCRFIKEFLQNEGIPLVAADLGGYEGRVVYFDSRDFGVYVRKIRKWLTNAIVERDRTVWKNALEKQRDNTESVVDLWLS